MLKFGLSVAAGALLVGAALVAVTPAQSADKLVFALVPKNTNNPFFDQAKLGCEKAVEEIGADKVECLFTGPPEHGYWMVPVEPASTGKSTQLGLEGTEPVTSSVGAQSPISQSESISPYRALSRDRYALTRGGPDPVHLSLPSSLLPRKRCPA